MSLTSLFSTWLWTKHCNRTQSTKRGNLVLVQYIFTQQDQMTQPPASGEDHEGQTNIWKQCGKGSHFSISSFFLCASTFYSNVLIGWEQSKAMTLLQKFIECLVSSLATSLIPHCAIQNQYNIFLPINNVRLKKVQMHASTVGCN